MTIYINEHPNPVYIVVDGVLKMIGSGEKFNSKSPISYEHIKPILKEHKKEHKQEHKPKKIKVAKDGNR